MHVIAKRPFTEAAKQYPNQRDALLDVYRVLSRKSVRFSGPEAMRKMFPSLDNFKYQDKWWVMNVGGNHLRMICFIQFEQNRLLVKHIVNHAEYDKLCERYRQGKM